MFKQNNITAVIAGLMILLSLTTVAQANQSKENTFWWPNLIDLSPLRQHAAESNPLGQDFNYAAEFNSLDLKALKADIVTLMKTSQDWWPSDYGHYGPFFIRMAWHSTGTYRTMDGRGGAGGGQQRFEPLNSWPDNSNLDKARRLLWPIKKKYGNKISWADLMVLTGDVALESMGFKTLGFAGGRTDDWEPDLVYWGPEKKFLASRRHTRGRKKLKRPLGATRMGLIYVNPEGPNGNHNPLDSARDIRETFARMAMDDEETVALIAGGHAFGKAHGARRGKCNGAAPAGAKLEQQGLGWKNKCGSGKGADTLTSGLEGAWTATPAKWSMGYLANLFAFKWVKTKSPAGATQWKPAKNQASKMVPDAHIKGKRHAPMMLTSDMALKKDPIYKKISQEFLKDPKKFEMAFARAWFKLTHRDLGPQARYLGSMAPKQTFAWQDPVPAVNHSLIGKSGANSLKKKIIKSGLTVGELVRTAWASASSFRMTDMRGGANGARVLLAPQKDWKINNSTEIQKVTAKLAEIREKYNDSFFRSAKVSMADMIVLGGAAAIEKAAKDAGHKIKVPFFAGRTDATQEMTNIRSFNFLESHADGFINYYSSQSLMSPIKSMIDKANLLGLSVPEMTVLVGGMRVLGANHNGTQHGVLTTKPGTLDNSFFVNLFDMSTKWTKAKSMYKGLDRKTGVQKWTATPVDLMFGSSSELRAIGEVYASNDGQQKFLNDFAAAWSKVMTADRFDLRK